MPMPNVSQAEVMPPAPPKKNGHAKPDALAVAPIDLIRMAVAQDLDVDKLAKLIELHIRWEANEARKAYAIAVNAFKAEAPQIVANATAKFPKKDDPSVVVEWDYATLDHVCNQLIECMSKHGLSHSWKTEQPEKNWIRVTCVLLHAQGHSEGHAVLEGGPDTTGSKNAIQAIGSTASYLERYTLLAAAGLAVKGMDDNGRASSPAAGDRVRDLCAQIRAAATIPDLQAIYTTAYKEAYAAGDPRAIAEYVAAKNLRKKELK